MKAVINPIYNATYRGIPIKSDSRAHDAVIEVLSKELINRGNSITVLDIATGHGALAQRVIDTYKNIHLDCNDISPKIQVNGARKFFTTDLNEDFDFNEKYDVILAIEIIEHLESPFHFLRYIQRNLKENGIIILTTPAIDSLYDRLFFLFNGYSYYFGSQGIINSEGHISMCPEWLLIHIAESLSLQFEMVSDSVDIRALLGWKKKLALKMLSPVRGYIKNDNNRSGLVCVFRQ